jgi:hypothetical protein
MVMVGLALAGVAVLIAIVVLAMGRGGEMGSARPDHPPLELPGSRALAGTDVALLRLPIGLVGYHTAITNEALRRIAAEIADRDTKIAVLERRLSETQERLWRVEGMSAPQADEDDRPPVVVRQSGRRGSPRDADTVDLGVAIAAPDAAATSEDSPGGYGESGDPRGYAPHGAPEARRSALPAPAVALPASPDAASAEASAATTELPARSAAVTAAPGGGEAGRRESADIDPAEEETW